MLSRSAALFSRRPTFTPLALCSKRFLCSGADEDVLQVRLSVLGVGGAGCNAVNTMIKKDLNELEFFITNTDAQSLQSSIVEKADQIQIGKELTKCLGAGANPEIGKQAAETDITTILEKIGDTNMIFITAGMGGGTGTGAAPVIAKALKDKGILTIGMVCMPFRFEGKRKMNLAIQGMKEMQKAVDTLIVVQNERLMLTLSKNQRETSKRVSLRDSFEMVDNIFYDGIKAVTDVIVKPGLINLDFADVRTITEGPSWGLMGSGFAEGHGKAETATIAALNNPLLSDTSKKNATGVLVSITGGPDLAILEVDEILRLIREEVSDEANVIFGATSEPEMKGSIRVSLILTGPYDDDDLTHPVEEPIPKESVQSGNASTPIPTPASPISTPPSPTLEKRKPQRSTPSQQHSSPRASQVFQVETEGETLSTLKQYQTEKESQGSQNPKETKKDKDSWWDRWI